MDKKLIIDEYLDYYRELVSKKYGNKCLVLLQNGMFYEVYNYRCPDGPDIHSIADLLNIQIGRKSREIETVSHSNYELLGFPMHSLQKFINILLSNGYTIAIYHQDENGKKNVNRTLYQIISPSTTLDYGIQVDNNFLMCIYLEPHCNLRDNFYICAYSFIDVTVGVSYIHETSSKMGDYQHGIDRVYQSIKRYNPKEVLIHVRNTSLSSPTWVYSREKLVADLELDMDGRVYHYRENEIPDMYGKVSFQNEFLGSIFTQHGLLTPIEYLELERYPSIVICYLLLLDFAKGHRIDIVSKLSKPIMLDSGEHLILAQNAIYQLNLVGDKHGTISLLSILNNCSTAFGKRLFRERLVNPHTSSSKLIHYYNIIDDLICEHKYKILETSLSKIMDLERYNRRIALGILTPAEFNNLHDSIGHIHTIVGICSTEGYVSLLQNFNEHYRHFQQFVSKYTSVLNIERLYRYTIGTIERSIFTKGTYTDIDELDDEIQNYTDRFTTLSKELCSYIEGADLEAGFVTICSNDRDGYYLEMTKKRCDSMRSRLKNCTLDFGSFTLDTKELVYTPTSSATSSKIKITGKPLRKWSDKINEKTNHMIHRSGEIYRQILNELDAEFHNTLSAIVKWVGEIDLLKTHAKNALTFNLRRPTIYQRQENDTSTSYSCFQAEGLRHPIVEYIHTKTPFVSNDIALGGANECGILCYGYNAVGKTTMQKAICLAIIMAQSGGFVAAQEFSFTPYRSIMTRISNADNLLKSQSSFMVEMMELKYILKHANQFSLVCIDELVSSTERFSGISLVCATIMELHKRGVSMFMATHLHELSKMTEITSLSNLRIVHLEVNYDDNTRTLIYDRKLRDGSGTGLYGLEVARFLDLDQGFMDTAFSIRNTLLGNEIRVFPATQSHYNPDVFLVSCKQCGYRPIVETDIPLETHHIHFQCNADENGNFSNLGFHKNVAHNLVSLCRKCHQLVHSGEITIDGYISTGMGPVLQTTKVETETETTDTASEIKIKIKTSTRTPEQIELIRSFFSNNPKHISKKVRMEELFKTHGIRIHYPELSRIITAVL
jgi:DNA mismatch repair protein MutS